MRDASRYERILVDCYRYAGFGGCASWCQLELLRLGDGRTPAIVTELEDNRGTSITNMCEDLAAIVCVDFSIDPTKLVWIEHYGYPAPTNPERPRTYDLVTFEILPAGHDALFANPSWRPMGDHDWRALGLEPRAPGP